MQEFREKERRKIILKMPNLSQDNRKLKEIPKEAFEREKLIEMSLRCNLIVEMKSDICKCIFNYSFPKKVNLKFLRKLDLSYNGLKNLNVLVELNSLEELILIGNFIDKVSEDILNMENLAILNLANNYIKEIPKEVFLLKNLKRLNFYGNLITELPKMEGIEAKNLLFLNLSKNGIHELPNWIGDFTELTDLLLDENNLVTFPKTIGSFIFISFYHFRKLYQIEKIVCFKK